MRSHARWMVPALALWAATAAAAQNDPAGNWTTWRGPHQNGISSATDLPLEWSTEKNVVWKTPMPHWSGATPVLFGDRLFLTSPGTPDPEAVKRQQEEAQQRGGRRGGGFGGGGRHPGADELYLLCVSAKDGAILWQKELDKGNQLWRKGNNASPSPVTDGTHVWVVTGTGMVTCFTMDGERVWQRNLQEDHGEFGLLWGYASSPLLLQGLLIVEVLHGFRHDDPSYVKAFDAVTGETAWYVERITDAPREAPDAYTTPLAVPVGDEVQVVITGADYITGHDPQSGEELWRVGGLNPRKAPNYRIVASPIFANGVVYSPTRVRPLTALRLGEEGAPTEDDIAWQWDDRGGPDVPSPVCDGERFYMVDDQGMATCLDAATGEVVWGPERTIQGTVSSSLLLADGRLYFTTEEGVTAVLKAGDSFELLASNELDGSYTLSTPIASGNRMYLRTGTHLYCLGKASE